MDGQVLAETKRDRVAFIDLLRIIACFLVIVNHTNSRIFLGTSPSVLWFLSLTYFFVCKIAVPVFVMITGFNLLDRQDSYKKSFLRVLRTGVCLLLFSGAYYIAYYFLGRIDGLSLKRFVAWVITQPITNAYWYMYLYLGILLMLPFLQKLAVNLQRTDFHVYFLISGLFFGIWPIVTHYIPGLRYSGFFILPLFNSYLCMLFLGCYIKRYCAASGKWKYLCALGFVLMCVLNVGLTYNEYVQKQGTNYLFFDNRELLPIVMASGCFFYIISTIRFGEKAKRWLTFLGKLTFGIYLVSDFFILTCSFVYNGLISRGMYPMLAMLIFEGFVFLASGVVAFVLKKIPLLKQLL